LGAGGAGAAAAGGRGSGGARGSAGVGSSAARRARRRRGSYGSHGAGTARAGGSCWSGPGRRRAAPSGGRPGAQARASWRGAARLGPSRRAREGVRAASSWSGAQAEHGSGAGQRVRQAQELAERADAGAGDVEQERARRKR
jgi:hypothetical protein